MLFFVVISFPRRDPPLVKHHHKANDQCFWQGYHETHSCLDDLMVPLNISYPRKICQVEVGFSFHLNTFVLLLILKLSGKIKAKKLFVILDC